MSLSFDLEGAELYQSGSQRIRVMSERWVELHQYCPACGYRHLRRLANNLPVADFLCEDCGEQFELKSKGGRLGRKIADGAYRTMIERITSDANPNFLLLSYSKLGRKREPIPTFPGFSVGADTAAGLLDQRCRHGRVLIRGA